jgi:hypothetical protein
VRDPQLVEADDRTVSSVTSQTQQPLAARAERAIVLLRGHRLMLDADLAVLYEVSVSRLNEQVRRNIERFPSDFMLKLTPDEAKRLRSQFAILDAGRGRHRKYPPLAFTEQGIAMLSSVLRSPRAVQVNIEIMRAFVRLRQMLLENADLARRLDELEARYDEQFRGVFDAIRELRAPPNTQKKRIGFET